MAKFFRSIRQLLLEENKFNKYLLYAIGEIVLVVIGILIALSINNWNENNKNEKKAHLFLIKISQDLEKDIEFLDEIISLDSIIFSDINQMQDDILNVEKVEEVRFNNSRFKYRFFTPDKTTYNSISSSGQLGLITNDSIINEWMSYYRSAESIRETTDESLKSYSQNIENFYTTFDHVLDNKMLKKKSISDYRENPFVLNSLRFKNGLILFQIRNYLKLKEQAQALLNLVNKEIGKH